MAKEMTEMPLGMSDDDMEWSSSYSRRLALETRSLSDRQSDRYELLLDAFKKCPPAALTVGDEGL